MAADEAPHGPPLAPDSGGIAAGLHHAAPPDAGRWRNVVLPKPIGQQEGSPAPTLFFLESDWEKEGAKT